MLRRFKIIDGTYIEKIHGQKRFAFGISDSADFYDLAEYCENGEYKGQNIRFYDLTNGDVYIPFNLKRNVVYDKPVYFDGNYYFMRGDFDEQAVTLYRYIPGKEPEIIEEFGFEEADLYNFRIMGEGIHVVSQNDIFRCYYPEKFSLELGEHESVIYIDDEKVYCQEWIEEGWDTENDCATENYKCYDNLVIRDFEGNIISKEIGSLYQDDDGTWWLA